MKTAIMFFVLAFSSQAFADVDATRVRSGIEGQEVVYVGVPIAATFVPTGQVFWALGR